MQFPRRTSATFLPLNFTVLAAFTPLWIARVSTPDPTRTDQTRNVQGFMEASE